MHKDVVVAMSEQSETTPIAHIVQIANQFHSSIYFEMDGNKKVNAKSIMGMMSLVLTSGSRVTIEANGEDATEAVTQLEKFLTE